MSEQQPINLQDRALENLQFIRQTMERAVTYTAISGRGLILIGLTALATAFISFGQDNAIAWLFVWLTEAALSIAIALGSILSKAQHLKMPVFSETGRKFVLSFAPAMLAGALMTAVCFQQGLMDLIPGLWLLLYGVAVVAGGTYSVPIIPVMGLCFMFCGMLALMGPAAWGRPLLALGFGVLHLIFGGLIIKQYGG